MCWTKASKYESSNFSHAIIFTFGLICLEKVWIPLPPSYACSVMVKALACGIVIINFINDTWIFLVICKTYQFYFLNCFILLYRQIIFQTLQTYTHTYTELWIYTDTETRTYTHTYTYTYTQTHVHTRSLFSVCLRLCAYTVTWGRK